MPNTEVKPFSADGTWLETAWESMSLPVTRREKAKPKGFVFFHIKNRGEEDREWGEGAALGQARLLALPNAAPEIPAALSSSNI